LIPKRKRGRPTKEAEEKYKDELNDFIQLMTRINTDVGFKMSSRGWCYALEPYGLGKGDFDTAQKLINGCRKDGSLPNGFMAEEAARAFSCLEEDINDRTPEEEAQEIIDYIEYAHEFYYPISFWNDKQYYIQMLVEKVDLKSLFEPLCKEYKIPIATAKGWSSIGQRKELIFRFKEHEEQGKTPVLLYCGDHDPVGLVISDFIKPNIDECYGSTKWKSDNLVIDRFGLNYDFIIQNKLSWIDNLETGAKDKKDLSDPKHPDHYKPYVQNYIKEYGVRKVEANAIVTTPVMGRKLCLDTINRYIESDAPMKHKQEVRQLQQQVKEYVQMLMSE
jgi:hypothetical protein